MSSQNIAKLQPQHLKLLKLQSLFKLVKVGTVLFHIMCHGLESYWVFIYSNEKTPYISNAEFVNRYLSSVIATPQKRDGIKECLRNSIYH